MKIKPGILWPAVIAGALALHVLVMAAMVWVVTTNDSYAVEPDYYAKALAWDERRAQDRRNAELGWRLDFTVVPAEAGEDPILRTTLADADGAPITGARIAVEAFSNIRRDQILTSTLAPTASGYEAALPMHGSGRWELRFTVTLGEDVFTFADTRHVWTHLTVPGQTKLTIAPLGEIVNFV